MDLGPAKETLDLEAIRARLIEKKLEHIEEKISHIHADIGVLARYIADINTSLSGLKTISDVVAQNPLFSRFASANTEG